MDNLNGLLKGVLLKSQSLSVSLFSSTHLRESCRNCLRARMYMALAIRPTINASPKAQAAAPRMAGPWYGARAGSGALGKCPRREEVQRMSFIESFRFRFVVPLRQILFLLNVMCVLLKLGLPSTTKLIPTGTSSETLPVHGK